MPIADYIGWIIAGLMLVPFAMLTLELVAALLPAKSDSVGAHRPRLAILVPAHNEEAGIGRTIGNILPQLQPGDRLLVIADNCTDQTTDVARQLGATVIERNNDAERGKGYALDFGVKHLAADAPEVVIVIDADTAVDSRAIDTLARAVAKHQGPIQGTNLLEAPAMAGPGTRISAFAFFVKNYIRPRGLNRLGLPCLLYGTGMAIPYDLLAKADLAHGEITEDIRLGLELAMQGRAPRFCPDARVFGEMPTGATVAKLQRRRWEHGHLQTLIHHVPHLLWQGLTRGRPKLLALALHIGIPPISFLFLVGAIFAAALAVCGQKAPAITVGAAIVVTSMAGFVSWIRFGRSILPWRDLMLMPVYVAKKIPLYLGFFAKPQREWVRTARTDVSTAENDDSSLPSK